MSVGIWVHQVHVILTIGPNHGLNVFLVSFVENNYEIIDNTN